MTCDFFILIDVYHENIVLSNENTHRQASVLDIVLGKSVSRILSWIVICLGPTLLKGSGDLRSLQINVDLVLHQAGFTTH